MSEAPRRNKLWLWSRSWATLIVCITDSLGPGLLSISSQRKSNIAGMCKYAHSVSERRDILRISTGQTAAPRACGSRPFTSKAVFFLLFPVLPLQVLG